MIWKQNGILTVLKYLRNFDPEKSNNPFAYITTIISNSFIGYITKQKKHSKIKNDLFDLKDASVEFEQCLSEKDKAFDYRELVNTVEKEQEDMDEHERKPKLKKGVYKKKKIDTSYVAETDS